MNQTSDLAIQELDTVILTQDIPEHHLRRGDKGAIVHCYSDGKAFEVEFLDLAGDTIALLTLTPKDIQLVQPYSILHPPIMADAPKVSMNFNAPVYGAVGNLEGNQIINLPPQNQNQALTEMIAILNKLQQNHPTATEAEAREIITAEFAELQVSQPTKWQMFRQQLLNRERWLNGGKAALSETAKHYVEGNVFYKVGLAFLDGFSADEDQGE